MPITAVRQLSQSTVFRGRVFDVERDRVRLPNGRTATLDIVRHRGSVVLIPQPDRGHVILIRQYRHAIRRWIWELPAGSIEAAEAPARAARRECAEEIGLVPGRLERVAVYFPTPGICDERMIFYRCQGLREPAGPVARDPDEQIRPRTFTLDDARRLIRRGQVVDMKTVIGLWLLEGRGPGR
ncbi:MAG TPA: NUDIX domain-containing protein [Vicinamibacterales bacterium]